MRGLSSHFGFFILLTFLSLDYGASKRDMQVRCLGRKTGGKMRWILMLFFVGSLSAFAKQVEGIDLQDELSVGTQKLRLNGAGLRVKRKFGLNFKVYVGGLYLAGKSQDAKAIINSADTKVLELVFLRSLDAATLREAWSEGFEKNCQSICDQARSGFNQFNALMTDVEENSRLKLTFTANDISVEVKGKTSASGKVSGEAIRKALLSIFIGDQPPTEDLKKALLGTN